MQVVELPRWVRRHIRHDLGYDVSVGDLGQVRYSVFWALEQAKERVREVEVKDGADTHRSASPHTHKQG